MKKDLRRLWLPVALFSLLSIGKLAFYAWVSGLGGAPGPTWLLALQSGPEFLLCTYAELLVAYFLVGWLVFEDSPIEPDAHWIARPISGGQMFCAKLLGAVLLFVLWPLGLHVAWWAVAGLGGTDMALAAVEFIAVHLLVVALGLACASLTDGFPRFTLWSLVGLGACVVVPILFALFDGGSFGRGVSRQIVWGWGGGLAALLMAAHQFVTRRRRRSLGLALASVLLVGILGGLWPWNLLAAGAPRAVTEDGNVASMQLTNAGPARYEITGRGRAKQHTARLALKATGIPEATLVAQVRMTGQWSFNGARVWTSKGGLVGHAQTEATIRGLLDFKPAAPVDDQIEIGLPISPQVVQRTAQEPATLHADMELDLLHGRVVAEVPLREVSTPTGRSGYTISGLAPETLVEKSDAPTAISEPAVQTGVSFLLTERMVDGLLPYYLQRRWLAGMGPGTGGLVNVHLLVNRRTGEFRQCDWRRSSLVAGASLSQVGVACWKLVFPLGPQSVRWEDYALVVVRFDGGKTIRRELAITPATFAEISPTEKP